MDVSENSPEALFSDIATYIEEVQAIISSGKWVDLAGLNQDIDALCRSVMALPPDVAKEYAPELEYLRDQMGEIEAHLMRGRDALKNEIKATQTVERANKAYAHSGFLGQDKKS
jgi:hypothetical protein